MAKTRRLIKESLPLVDGVCEILDARVPLSSQNPEIDEITARKPRIILLNKCDLADPKATEQFIEYFRSKGFAALAVDCKSGKGLEKFRDEVKQLLKSKIESNIAKGMPGKSLKLMVVGIPNTGKSTFINRISANSKAIAADRPGVTRSNQWFQAGKGLEMLDTPGVLWPKFEDAQVGFKLSFIRSVKDEILDIEEIAVKFLELMIKNYPQLIEQRYKIDVSDVFLPFEALEMIARSRGMLLKKGEYDTERAANALLEDYRTGKLGRLTLDSVGEIS